MIRILDELGFADFYFERISKTHHQIDYGKRTGKVEFSSIKSAAEQHIYESSGKYTVNIDRQINSLADVANEELILQCIEVFDWGGVQSSNIIDALNLHRKNELKSYLIACKAWFENDQDLTIHLDKVIWSSGWTKVFSFMFELTTIYDSRVSAYINYIFVTFYESLKTQEQKSELILITKHLISFRGSQSRVRCLNREMRNALMVKMKSTNNRNSFIANKVASWFLTYLCKLEYGKVTQSNFRQIDKAMFMLGFDIKQIQSCAPFQ